LKVTEWSDPSEKLPHLFLF